MTSLYETLQRCRFCNVARHFHRNYIATSERRWIATSQQRCNDVFLSTGQQAVIRKMRKILKVAESPKEHIWETASGVSLRDCFQKNGEWQKSNAEHFQIFQNQFQRRFSKEVFIPLQKV